MATGLSAKPSIFARLRRRLARAPSWENHRPGALWRLARLLIASSKDHAFLDRAWVGCLLRLAPPRLRRPLAMRLLSLSPHYWVYQWTNIYPAELGRAEILQREYDRNAASRRELCEKLLRRLLRPRMTVLDFGCGPGFLAAQVSRHVARVIATDVSRGVIACAGQINPAENIAYVTNGLSDLGPIDDASIDLVYSFAVFQHLRKEQTLAFLREFARVLRPGAMGVFHSILKEPGDALLQADPNAAGWIARRVNLRMVYFTAAELTDLLHKAGLTDVHIAQVSTLAQIDDDIGQEHLVSFRRQGEPEA